MSLESFIHKIENFNEFSSSLKIDFFVYYHTIILGNEGIKSKEITDYFEELKISKYSNIPQYLSSNSKKARGKTPKFILQKGTYHLERSHKNKIDEAIGKAKALVVSDNYFPSDLFDNTRQYLKSIAGQASSCYDVGLYDACSVMTRKLLEVLIIEAFEKHKIAHKIQNSNGNFFYLSDLIDKFTIESAWIVSRNAKTSIPSLKKMGDLSAHNRRYIARKGDIDKVKDDLRIVLEELIHLIDYSNWKP